MSFQNKNKYFFVLPTSKIYIGNVSKKEASRNIIIDLKILRILEFQRKNYSIIYEAVKARYYHL